jgi:hypothetical protein
MNKKFWMIYATWFLAGFAFAKIQLGNKEIMTPHLHLIKPTIGSKDWGEKINQDLDILDKACR